MTGGKGEFPPVGGSKGREPLASANVLHWVGWLPGTTRCGAGLAVPASPGASAPHETGAGGDSAPFFGAGAPRRRAKAARSPDTLCPRTEVALSAWRPRDS